MAGTSEGQAARRQRTRTALLGAAQELLAAGQGHASIDQIARLAGVGVGSFYNHFASREALFSEAVHSLLDVYADLLRDATADIEDPAEVFATSFRLTARMAQTSPQLLTPALANGADLLLLDRGLRPTALADISAGVASGRFVDADPEVLFMAAGGALMGLVVQILNQPEVDHTEDIDLVTTRVMCFLGLDKRSAQRVSSRPLPGVGISGISQSPL